MQTALGISGGTWSNYENNKTEPQIQTLIAIAEYFEVGLDDLLRKDLSNYPSSVAQAPAFYRSGAGGSEIHGSAPGGETADTLKEMLDEIKGLRADLQIFLNSKP